LFVWGLIAVVEHASTIRAFFCWLEKRTSVI
jgi:hypothetical protein